MFNAKKIQAKNAHHNLAESIRKFDFYSTIILKVFVKTYGEHFTFVKWLREIFQNIH